MELFDDLYPNNLLPFDGVVEYKGRIMPENIAKDYYEKLLQEIPWKHDEAIMFGKKIITKRKVAWYGDQKFSYTYSNVTKTALLWNKELLGLKKLVEDVSEETYNSCLLNLYHNGSEGMAWHSDDEKALNPQSAIASLTFGAERIFSFKHKSKGEKISLKLASGSLLIMKGETQKHWLHRLAPSTKVFGPRINLTFRKMVG